MVSDEARKLPDFLVIGAGRSGTTALQYWLMQHPQIFMCPVKETNFFSFEGAGDLTSEELGFPRQGDDPWVLRQLNKAAVRDLGDYSALFSGARSDAVLGEISPSYLYSPRAPERIVRHIPDARLVVVLRQPVERAFSAFVQQRRTGDEPVSDFARTLEREYVALAEGQGGARHELRVGLYHDQLRRYLNLFPRGKLKVYLYDQLQDNASGVMVDLFAYLGVDPTFTPDVSVTYNAAGTPRNQTLDRLLRRRSRTRSIMKRALPIGVVRRLAELQNRVGHRNLMRAELSGEQRAALTNRYYRDDIMRTQDLLGIDLSHWLV